MAYCGGLPLRVGGARARRGLSKPKKNAGGKSFHRDLARTKRSIELIPKSNMNQDKNRGQNRQVKQ